MSALLGFGGAVVLLARSVIAFSHTGPAIRKEIRRHYLGYTVLALARLGAWSAVVMAWAACLPMLSLCAWAYISNEPVSMLGWLLAGLAGIGVITLVQFCSHLLQLPSGLVMSSNYNMARFYGLWRHLSVSGIRWARLVIACVCVGPVVIGLWTAADAGDWRVLLTLLGASCLLYGPVIYAWWPVTAPVRQSAGKSRDGRPNVLLIGCDTLRADRLGIFGYSRNTTPFLDVYARRGAAFRNCYTPLARTAPSLASLLTGVWPEVHGIRTNYVDAEETQLPCPALPEMLKKVGYRTAVIGDWAGSDLNKLSFGFEVRDLPDDQWNMRYLIRQGPKDVRLFLSLFAHNRFGCRFLPEIYYLAGVPLTRDIGAKTRSLISRLARDEEPFLINVFMATAHPPFGTEYPYYSMFADADYQGPSKFAMARLAQPEDIIRSQREPKEAFDLDQVIDLYDGCVRRFDDETRSIIQHLEACGLAQNTIVVIYSDHGMEFFEHGTWGQGNSIYGEASAKVPLVIVGPGIAEQGADDRTVRTVDLVPTLLELCKLPVPPHVQGVSLKSYLTAGGVDLGLPALFETGLWLAPPPGMPPEHLRYPELLDLLEIRDKRVGTLAIKREFAGMIDAARDRMVRRGKWKLIRLALQDGPVYRLYNVEQDPDQTTDLTDCFPDTAAALRRELEEWLASDCEGKAPGVGAGAVAG